MAVEIDLTLVDDRLRSALGLLRRTFSQSAVAGGGWYHRLDMSVPGPTATSLGLRAFSVCDENFEHFRDGLAFLRARQVQSADSRLDGGWANNTSLEFPVVEATGWVGQLLGLARCSLLPESPDAGRTYHWLVNNQNPEGGWGSLYGCTPRTWLTCLALRALSRLNPFSPAIDRGVEWLMDHRSQESAWGEYPGAPGTVTHTAIALLTISEARPRWQDDRLLKAYSWLEKNVDTSKIDDGHARIESYSVTRDSPNGTVVWNTTLLHYGLPVALSALLRHPRTVEGNVVGAAAKTILESQLESGNWPNVHGASGNSIWSLWPFVQALTDIKRLPLTRPHDRLHFISSAAIVAQRASTGQQSLSTLIKVDRRQSRTRVLVRYWAAAVLACCLLGGLAAFATNALDGAGFLLGMVLPVLLFTIQEVHFRRAHNPPS